MRRREEKTDSTNEVRGIMEAKLGGERRSCWYIKHHTPVLPDCLSETHNETSCSGSRKMGVLFGSGILH